MRIHAWSALSVSVTLTLAGCFGVGEADDAIYDPYQSVGASAQDLLASNHFTSLVIEVQSVEGYEPSTNALYSLQRFAETHLHKPDGVRIVEKQPIPSPGKGQYTTDDVRAIEHQYRSHFSLDREAAVFLLFLDGPYAQNSAGYNTLGQAYWNTSIVLFEPTIRQVTQFEPGDSQQRYATAEMLIMIHEFGHLLGLVNEGSPMKSYHRDTDHGAHCLEPQCIMHFAFENATLTEGMMSTQLPELDPNCLADLRANGGK